MGWIHLVYGIKLKSKDIKVLYPELDHSRNFHTLVQDYFEDRIGIWWMSYDEMSDDDDSRDSRDDEAGHWIIGTTVKECEYKGGRGDCISMKVTCLRTHKRAWESFLEGENNRLNKSNPQLFIVMG